VRAFLRQRLGIVLGDFDDEVGDSLTVELDHLEQWGVGTRLLEGRLAGAEMEDCVAAEVARGLLPPGRLGDPVLARLRPTVDQLAEYALRLGEGASRSADVKLELGDGRILSGTVPGIHDDLLRVVQYSRVGPKHRIALWVRWLALTAAYPDRPIQAVLLGRARAGA
jgi:exodeoxyribonuclease V gamma subunit